MATATMKLLFWWITLHMCLCHQPQNLFLRHERISFQLDSRESMADLSGPVYSHISKVKCTLLCFENTSCTSVLYWKNKRKCRTTTAPQEPAERGGHGNATLDPKTTKQDPKVNKQEPTITKQDPKIKLSKPDPVGQVYYGVLRNFFQPMVWIYFKEIDLYLIYYKDQKLFQEAERVCNDLKGDTSLFQIDSQKKQNSAVRLVEHSAQEKVFIGMYYDILRGWRYIDRSMATYTNWAAGKANSPQFARSAMLVKKNGYKWKTTGLDEKTGWICQKKPKN